MNRLIATWQKSGTILATSRRAGGHAFRAETAEAVQHAPVLVWQLGAEKPNRRYHPDRFSEAAMRVVSELDPQPQETVVVTLEGGVKHEQRLFRAVSSVFIVLGVAMSVLQWTTSIAA